MLDILYFGPHPATKLEQLLQKANCRLVYANSAECVSADATSYSALVLHWKSQEDQQVIKMARQAGVPALVITASLAASLRSPEPRADVYLEAPASAEEISALLIDMSAVRHGRRDSVLSMRAGAAR